ncbi:MAG: aconitase X swivel domain-containing protein [Huintestinicola sp.]
MKEYKCHKISEGVAEGEILLSEDDFCFYLVDPKTGVVIEKNHCLFGKSIAGKVLVFPNGKGSSVVQADGMYQLKMTGMEPKAMIIKNPDTTLVASAIIMEEPLVDRVEAAFYDEIKDGDVVCVDATNGIITVKED